LIGEVERFLKVDFNICQMRYLRLGIYSWLYKPLYLKYFMEIFQQFFYKIPCKEMKAGD